MDNLKLEAEAFDSQIVERVKNGHIPDLRYAEKCEWFYNNIWRHPDYIKMDFGEIFELVSDAISKNIRKDKINVLEVGCGPGFISLELARAGYQTTGIDLSSECIQVSNHFANKDPHKSERGSLKYISGDFFSNSDLREKYDAIVFVGALHHFPNQEQVLGRAEELLNEKGIVIVHEPTRDRVEKKNAAIHQLIITLLGLSGGYYKVPASYTSIEQIKEDVEGTYRHLKYEEESGEKSQSVNDNSAGHKEMYFELSRRFKLVDYQERYALFHEIIGGLRFDDAMNRQLALTIKLFDKYLCEEGVIQPTEFFYVGRKN